MKAAACISVISIMFLAAGASADLVPGDRMLVDVGTCWGDEPSGYGPVPSPASDGNYWNNHSHNPRWNQNPIDLVTTTNKASGATFHLNMWAQCADGEQIAGNAPASTLYPGQAQTDCRWWNAEEGGLGVQPGIATIAGLNPDLTYDVVLFGYATSGQVRAGGHGPFADGTTVYTIGGSSVELNVMDNTTDVASFFDIATDASGVIVVEMIGGTPAECMAVLNVVDITALPEPGTILLLAIGGLAALRRRR